MVQVEEVETPTILTFSTTEATEEEVLEHTLPPQVWLAIMF